MSNESEKKLTVNDPVDATTMKHLAEVDETRKMLAAQLLDLEEEKIRLLVAARPLRDERDKVFQKILMDRGLPPDFPVDIDETGKLFPLKPIPKG